ncbi:isoleucyl-tRNA synthetase [Nitzschia inconspicua]|uniref:isoleucine--tRNA ligase n=1 Tax=Nitzschia inconspicua TaxID=303405 RepID=A0A9K3KRY4_9STRA|nr:isoleucyl-tRNA synthetase [Nitzschia inconspicua]
MASLPPTLNFSDAEEEICKKWKDEDTFRLQNKLSKERGDEEFTFYDGPPFATGLPHYGHILAGTIKDTVTRYASMTGKHVDRRAGWDCHGLPVEYEIDQKLGITHRDQVLAMGIDKYNATCRSIVTRYTEEWETTITRLGRWIDFQNDYKTMDASFMESVWWVFSQLYEKNLIYQGFKVMPYSTGCSTSLSNFEAGLNYKEVSDPAVVVSFPVVGEEDVSLIAWTTTPWTLPSNLALCVNPEMEYVQILDKNSGKKYILAKSRLSQLYPIMNNKKKWKPTMADELYQVQKTMKGIDLKGKRYQPLFDFFASQSDAYFQVVSDTYVTDDAGTGVVHQAPAFGEDDFRVCLANGIIKKGVDFPCPVDADGLFTDEVPLVKGIHVKQADNTLIATLKEAGRLVHKDSIVHSYPFCWRSDTPLIYKTVPSWFVKVEEIRDQVVANNEKTYWVPSHVGSVRFHNWLKDARDWAISRNRFWGTPLPIWTNDDMSEIICIGSIAQLEELTGTKVTDLHRESIDSLEIPSKKNPGQVLKRIDEVFDCWFESGSMPYAQKHYPFENKEEFEKGFPADFIAEGLDQTRGWFYTLMILSTALFGEPAMKNVIVNGLVLAEDGKKMSKRLKNYPDPTLVIHKYGADALRMYLINSPVVRAEELKFKESGVLGVVKEVFLPWYNAFRFFVQNVERWESETGTKFTPSVEKVRSTKNSTDIWISAATQELIKYVHDEMEAYRLYTVMPALVGYVTQLTNWYVRLNRDRLKGLEGEGEECHSEAEMGLQVLYDVLLDVTIIMGPFTPFLAEFFYQHLRKLQPSYAEAANGGGTTLPTLPGKSDSVHFLKLPQYDESRLNHDAVEAMEALQGIVEQGRNAREKRNISLRTPVKQVVAILRSPSASVVEGLNGPLKKYILSELNAWDFLVVPKNEQHDWVTLSLTPNFKVVGKKVGNKMKAIASKVQKMSHEEAVRCLEEGKLVVEDVELDAVTELISKLSFSKEGDHWEATPSADGATVVALDTTQDDSIISAGMARELINHVQQLRKAAGLELKDIVEVFFEEEEGITSTEDAVAKNVDMLDAKFKGSIPLPKRFAPSWSVVLKSELVDVGGSKVIVSVCRPAVAVNDFISDAAKLVLSTKEPSELSLGETFKCSVDGKEYELKEGVDFWLSSAAKAKAVNAVSWLN